MNGAGHETNAHVYDTMTEKVISIHAVSTGTDESPSIYNSIAKSITE